MGVTVDPSGDWKLLQGVDPVNFYPRVEEGLLDVPTPTKGKMMPLLKEEMEGDTSLAMFGVVWHLWKSLMPDGMEPKYSDVIEDKDGKRYTVHKNNIVALGTRYRLVCLRDPNTTSFREP